MTNADLRMDVDFIIWITPFKDLPENIHFLPQICVFDMKRIKLWERYLIDYRVDDLICMEVEQMIKLYAHYKQLNRMTVA